MKYSHDFYNKDLKTFARENRKKQTPAEMLLWAKLRNKQLLGYKFLRQRTISTYIVDFLQPETSVIIEVDGSSHDDKKFEYDLKRERDLINLGYRIVRFSEFEVKTRIDETIETIVQTLLVCHSPSPSSTTILFVERSQEGESEK